VFTPPETNAKSYGFPPGVLGEIASFILAASPRPVPEIALAGAIGLFAGIVGRSYNISGTGLNQYVLLVAKTGRGKEAMAAGVSKLMKVVKQSIPSATEFEGPTEIASPQALIKWLGHSPSIYSIVGEFGLKLKEMSSPQAPIYTSGLKRILLDLYQKSGEGSVLGAMAYSNKDENTAVVNSPAFTLVGESTPETLFEQLSEGLITNGLLPRFMVIEYNGPRTPLSQSHETAKPSVALQNKLAEVIAHSKSLQASGAVQRVAIDPAAITRFATFNDYCDHQINSESEGLVGCELWNRAHLKALKLAALVAVGQNYIDPKITGDIAMGAIEMTRDQTAGLCARFRRGELGSLQNSEAKQTSEILRVLAEYITSPFEATEKYGGTREMHEKKIIPASYIQRRLVDTAAFRGKGATRAINERLREMLDADELRQLPKNQMIENFGTGAKAFAVANPQFILEYI